MKKKFLTPLFFLAPSLIIISCFVIFPVFFSFYISLTDFNVRSLINWGNAKFIGLANYKSLLQDQLFLKCIVNTLYFVVLMVPLALVLSLALALLLNLPITRFRNFFRIGFFMPYISDAIAITTVWYWVVSKDYGILNLILGWFGIEGPSWLTDTRYAMLAIVGLVVWRSLGYYALLYLAGLQNIPEQLYEAAEIDGATGGQKIRYITIPLLAPTTLFISITSIIGGFQLFAEPLTLTNGGGPMDATKTIVLFIYENGFRYFKMGYSAASSYILFAFIFIVTLIQIKFRDQEISY
ncbi:MAG TPA: sugar ABC transporter permease [Firmicutes bacterium]|nr:sugar ABC transporter permease [Bacillota bacterium]